MRKKADTTGMSEQGRDFTKNVSCEFTSLRGLPLEGYWCLFSRVSSCGVVWDHLLASGFIKSSAPWVDLLAPE